VKVDVVVTKRSSFPLLCRRTSLCTTFSPFLHSLFPTFLYT